MELQYNMMFGVHVSTSKFHINEIEKLRKLWLKTNDVFIEKRFSVITFKS